MTSLDEAFTTCRDAWRIEARDRYLVGVEQPLLDAFHRGQDVTVLPREDGWLDILAAAGGRGARISRTRLVGHPVSEYTRFEFTLYPANIAAGEDVQVVDRAWLDGSWTSVPDVWLFDGELAFLQRYTEDGSYLGAEQVAPEPYLEVRRRLAQVAVPFAEYALTEIPGPRPGSIIAPRMPHGVAAARE